MTIEEYNLEKIREIEVTATAHNNVRVKISDLRELLFRFPADSTVRIDNSILYKVLIQLGVKVKGFQPNKTALRHTYGLSIEQVNAILPGSFTSAEGDGRRRGNPRK